MPRTWNYLVDQLLPSWSRSTMYSERLASIRKNLALGALRGFYNNVAYWGGKHPHANPDRHDVEVLRDISYDEASGAAHHHLDVYRPKQRPKSLPVVVYIHGGGFRMLSKDTHWLFALGFARAGYVVFNLNYRLAPQHVFPAAPTDVCKAYEWIVENAQEYGGDPTNIVLAGESAGANLATTLAIASCCKRHEPWTHNLAELPPPVGVMPSCGLHQVSDPQRFARRRKLHSFIQMELEQIACDYVEKGTDDIELASPLLVLETGVDAHRKLPPFHASVGTKDPVLDDTRRLSAALERLGVPCETHYYPGGVHAFHAMVWQDNAKQWWRNSLRFLKNVTR